MQNEFLINETLGDIDVEIGGLEESQKELIYELEVRPGRFLFLKIILNKQARDTSEKKEILTKTGSSSSGSKASPYGLTFGASVRNKFTENCTLIRREKEKKENSHVMSK